MLRFRADKPVMGLPVAPTDSTSSLAEEIRCAPEGTMFLSLDDASETQRTASLYSVTKDGEATHLIREAPPLEFKQLHLLDSFAAEHEYVDLVEAEEREQDSQEARRPDDRHFFLAVTEADGSDGRLVSLDVKFEPLKIAMFDGGGFLLLGWDRANLLPELALLKDDGTLRRYVDPDNRASDGGSDPLTSSRPSSDTLAALRSARFAAFGKSVTLAQVGGTAPIHVLSPIGEDRKVPVVYPAGMVMRDVLASQEGGVMIMRVKEPSKDKKTALKEELRTSQRQRVFEVDANHGSLVRELLFDSPSPAPADLVCAPPGKILAFFQQLLPGVAAPVETSNSSANGAARQWVVGSAPR